MATVYELSTPCLVLDQNVLHQNIAGLNQRLQGSGVKLRPHMKTAKSIEVARLACKDHFGGITVSTMNEADYFSRNGITDMIYAVCVTPEKLARIAELQKRGCRIAVIIDSTEMAEATILAADKLQTDYDVYIEIDSGESRTGVSPEDPLLFQLAGLLGGASSVNLKGILTHAGHSYGCRTPEALAAVAEQERLIMVQVAESLRAKGFACPEISIGSTPTAMYAKSFEGITELRAGVYMFSDLFQRGLGAVPAGMALSVLASVISHRKEKNRFIIDAGALALSKDRSTGNTSFDAGYGLVLNALGGPTEVPLTVTNVHQEHGEVGSTEPIPFERFPIGSKVRVYPNHACTTGAMHGVYHLVETNQPQVLGQWTRTNGWD